MIHVVTAAHNRKAVTASFIQTLKSQTYPEIHLVFVDDGCTDGTVEMVRDAMPESTILHGDGNLWWGGAMDMAYHWLSKQSFPDSDNVLICNDDTTFEPDMIERGVQLLQENPGVWPVVMGYAMPSGELKDGLFYHDVRTGEGALLGADQTGNCASTRCVFLRLGDWRKVGGFHPILLPHYASDFEFTIRASRKGFVLKTFSDLVCQYNENTTGVNEYESMTRRKLFSKRSNSNPFYKISFILLSTPMRYWFSHLRHQCKRYASKLSVFMIYKC